MAKKVADVTVHMRRKDGKRVTKEEAKRALWAAHKIAQRGGDPFAELREWTIEAINWRNVYKSGREKTYRYDSPAAIADVIGNIGGIMETIGMDKLRVAVPERG